MGTEVTHCRAAGAGQAVKLMNNMVVAQTVVALAEALAVARASGSSIREPSSRRWPGSRRNSFVLGNHGMKSLLPDQHPTENAFPTVYILKDLSHALDLAQSCGITPHQATTTKRLMEETAAAGYAREYYTAVLRVIERPESAGIPSPRPFRSPRSDTF